MSPHAPPRPPSTITSRPAGHGTTPSDTTDAEWQILGPYVPAGTGRGRPITYPRRDVIDAIRYLGRTGCQWDALPADFPHHKLVYHYFRRWTADGSLTRMRNSLREQVREHVEGRERQPSAALVDSQSLRGAETSADPTAATTPPRRSTAGSVISRSTPAPCCSRSW
ncbi:transposase [Plantactinospora endophytica]|uniref:transposase n=1 Tax=Plantactinospora endophytica TaxID=673535 RepID=UPI001940ACE6|nr:transposase [Plantactinospora endophytica]